MSSSAVLVFIVEDEETLREVLKEELKDSGFAVAEASNGDEALSQLQSNGTKYHALLTDINLGTKVNGWDIAHRAQEIVPGIPVVYLTSAGTDEWFANGVPNSILIYKPYAAAQVVTAIAHLLDRNGMLGAQ